jgi:preprotein translocase subunit YajC
MQVVDPKGAAVGTVSGVTGDLVVVKTDRHEVSLPKSSFTLDQGKLLFGMTQAELNAASEKSIADAAAALVAGATVKGSGGESVGTIDSIDAEFATIKLTSGKQVRVPRSGLGVSAEGPVIGMSAAQLEAQAQPPADASAGQ